jgi:hypothetical protein
MAEIIAILIMFWIISVMSKSKEKKASRDAHKLYKKTEKELDEYYKSIGKERPTYEDYRKRMEENPDLYL